MFNTSRRTKMGAIESLRAQEHKLAEQLREVLSAGEEFMLRAGHETGDKLEEARKKFESITRHARREFEDTEALLLAKGRAAAASTDAYVRAHPWTAAGIGAGVGLLIGLLINGRR
jgi:ElaB/YqjD/DUF883 family membrane-anchored ribosome-binding protein